MTKYVCLSIPESLIQLVEENMDTKAYQSKTDFVKQAIRREIERIQKQKKGAA